MILCPPAQPHIRPVNAGKGPQQQVHTLGVNVLSAKVEDVVLLHRWFDEAGIIDAGKNDVQSLGATNLRDGITDTGRNGQHVGVGAQGRGFDVGGGTSDEGVLLHGVAPHQVETLQQRAPAPGTCCIDGGKGGETVDPQVVLGLHQVGGGGKPEGQTADGVGLCRADPHETDAVPFLHIGCAWIATGENGDFMPLGQAQADLVRTQGTTAGEPGIPRIIVRGMEDLHDEDSRPMVARRQIEPWSAISAGLQWSVTSAAFRWTAPAPIRAGLRRESAGAGRLRCTAVPSRWRIQGHRRR